VKESKSKLPAPPMTWDEFCKLSFKSRQSMELDEFIAWLRTSEFEAEIYQPEPMKEAS
jgi:hypothetical protein